MIGFQTRTQRLWACAVTAALTVPGCASHEPAPAPARDCPALAAITAEIDAINDAHRDAITNARAEETPAEYESWEQETSYRRSDLFEQYALIAPDIRLVDTTDPCFSELGLMWSWMFAGARHAIRAGDTPAAMGRIEVLDAIASRAGYAQADRGPSLLIDARRLGTVILARDGFAANTLDAATAGRLAAIIDRALPEIADQYARSFPCFPEAWAGTMRVRQFFRKQYGLSPIEWTTRDTERLAAIVAPLLAEWNDPAAGAAMDEKAQTLDGEMREAVECLAFAHRSYRESLETMISTRGRLRAFIATGVDPGPDENAGY